LLSGLVFPVIGQFVLKCRLRAAVLIVLWLAASSIIITGVIQQAQMIVERITRGEISADDSAIMQMISDSTAGTDGSMRNAAVGLLGVCWLVGIIDSYRLGAAQEE